MCTNVSLCIFLVIFAHDEMADSADDFDEAILYSLLQLGQQKLTLKEEQLQAIRSVYDSKFYILTPPQL